MTTLHDLNGKKVLPMKAPKGWDKYVRCGHRGVLLRFSVNGVWQGTTVPLPPGNYQLLGRAGELTEEKCRGLVESERLNKWDTWYRDYESTSDDPILMMSALESWQSFCRVNGIEPDNLILIDNENT